MVQLAKFSSIEQFRNVVKHVDHTSHYAGVDDDGKVIYDRTRKNPTIRYIGTVKLHGTNAGVGYNPNSREIWAQSRENIITVEKDNAGFAAFQVANKELFLDMCMTALGVYGIDRGDRSVIIYGEWCGKGIQSGVGISELPKMFVIFNIALVDKDGQKEWFSVDQLQDVIDGCKPLLDNIHSIYEFKTYGINIDFENPHEVQNQLTEWTLEVEAECPVAKAFGINNSVGEGIVWKPYDVKYNDSGYWFKVKGNLHSKTKVKTLAPVDVERINNIKELAEKLTPQWRLEQMFQQTFDTLNGGEPDIKRMGEYIKAVMTDVFKEESDTVAASGFTGKDISGPISKIARDFMMKQLDM